MNKIIIISFLLLVICPFKAQAIEEITQGASLSVEDCIELAVKNSPEVQIYKEYVEMYNARIGQTKSNYFPSIGASAGYDFTNTESKYRASNSKNFSASVYLNQLIYSFGKVFSQVKMQKFYKIAAEFDLENSLVSTVNNVKTAYYGVLAAKANIDIAKANLLVNERQYNRTKAFYDEGLVSRIDLVNQEVYVSDAQISLVSAENEYQNSIVSLNNAMYITDAPEYQIQSTETFNFKDNFAEINLLNVANTTTKEDGTVEPKEAVLTTQVEKTEILENYKFVPYPYTLEESINIAYEKRADLLSMTATEKAVKEALKYTKKEYFPDLTGQVGYNWGNNTYYSSNGINLGAYLSTSNLNIMETRYKIKESKAELEVAKKNVELTKKNIYFEVQNAYINMAKLEKNIPIMKTKVRQTLENYELADARYEVGLGNFIELQDAKENYNNAQRDYVENIYNYNVALADLQAAMGER